MAKDATKFKPVLFYQVMSLRLVFSKRRVHLDTLVGLLLVSTITGIPEAVLRGWVLRSALCC